MTSKTKRIITIVACAAVIFTGVLAGCAAKANDLEAAPGSMAYDSFALPEANRLAGRAVMSTEPAAVVENYDGVALKNAVNSTGEIAPYDEAEEGAGPQDGRFVIATANISVQTKTYDAFNAALKTELKAMGGYTNAFEEWNYDGDRHATVTARVPSQKLDAFLESLEKNGTVINRSVNTSDVTDEMIETGSKKEALMAEEKALLEILGKAKNVEEIITVQDRLSYVRSELQSYSQKLQNLQNQVNYSTVNIDVREVNRITTPTQKFGALASSGFLASLRDIGSGLRNFALWFIGAIPWLILLAVPVTVAVILIVRRRRNKKAKKAAMDA